MRTGERVRHVACSTLLLVAAGCSSSSSGVDAATDGDAASNDPTDADAHPCPSRDSPEWDWCDPGRAPVPSNGCPPGQVVCKEGDPNSVDPQCGIDGCIPNEFCAPAPGVGFPYLCSFDCGLGVSCASGGSSAEACVSMAGGSADGGF